MTGDAPRPDLDDAERPNFEGHIPRDCGEHRTVGGRAWCHDCREWCYPRPEMGCLGCEVPWLRAGLADAQAEIARLREIERVTQDLRETWDAFAGSSDLWKSWPGLARMLDRLRALAAAPAPAEDER